MGASMMLFYILCFFKYVVSIKGLVLTKSKDDPCVSFKSLRKVQPKTIFIYYVRNCCIIENPEYVDEMKNKPRKVGVRFERKRIESGEIYAVMSLNDKE